MVRIRFGVRLRPNTLPLVNGWGTMGAKWARWPQKEEVFVIEEYPMNTPHKEALARPEETKPSLTGREYLHTYAYLFSLAGFIVALDQWTKWLVRENIPFRGAWNPIDWLAPYARIVFWKNTGAAFGIFQQGSTVFTILAFVVALAIIYYFPQVPRADWPLRLAMSLQLGGALGNLADRLARGYVTDFLSVGNFPVFNVADASISVGVVVLLVGVWITERQQKRALETAELSAANAALPEDERPGEQAYAPPAETSPPPDFLTSPADTLGARRAVRLPQPRVMAVFFLTAGLAALTGWLVWREQKNTSATEAAEAETND